MGKLQLAYSSDKKKGKEIKLRKEDPPKKKVKVREKRAEIVAANFGRHSEKIIGLLEMDDSDGATILITKKLLQTTIDLIPLAEENVRETGAAKGIYQFNTLISQARELLGDIQALSDKKYVANRIIKNVMEPAFMAIAHQMLTSHVGFRELGKQLVPQEHQQEFNTALRDLGKEIAQVVHQKYEAAVIELNNTLQA